MQNLWFLGLVAVVGLIRWILQAVENKKNEQAARRTEPAPAAPIQRAPAETEEERMRRFFEALGVPQGAAPPRRVVPRAKQKIRPIDAFPLPNVPPIRQAPPAVSIPELPVASAPVVLPAQLETNVTKPITVTSRPAAERVATIEPASFAARLANGNGLRDAIILREIFGPPRSMQPLDMPR
jgi:hypothetical protein